MYFVLVLVLVRACPPEGWAVEEAGLVLRVWCLCSQSGPKVTADVHLKPQSTAVGAHFKSAPL